MAVGACASDLQPRLQRCEGLLREAQQRQLDQPDNGLQQQELERLRTEQQQANTKLKELQATLKRMDQQLISERTMRLQLQQTLQNPRKPVPGVRVDNDIWGGSINGAVGEALSRHTPQLHECYRASLKRMAGSSGWLVLRFDVTTRGLSGLKIEQKRLLDPKLEACAMKAVRRLKVKAPKGRWRVAQNIIFRPDRNVARAGDAPQADYKWPPVPASMRAPAGGICRVGSRRQGVMLPTGPKSSEPLDPFQARPCQAGLKCCYGCGIPGCDSTCMSGSCPRYP